MPIVWTFPDRHIEVTYLTESWLASQRREGETTAQAVERLAVEVAAKTPRLLQGVPHLVKSADLPASRTDRADWTYDRRTKVVRVKTLEEKLEPPPPPGRPQIL